MWLPENWKFVSHISSLWLTYQKIENLRLEFVAHLLLLLDRSLQGDILANSSLKSWMMDSEVPFRLWLGHPRKHQDPLLLLKLSLSYILFFLSQLFKVFTRWCIFFCQGFPVVEFLTKQMPPRVAPMRPGCMKFVTHSLWCQRQFDISPLKISHIKSATLKKLASLHPYSLATTQFIIFSLRGIPISFFISFICLLIWSY